MAVHLLIKKVEQTPFEWCRALIKDPPKRQHGRLLRATGSLLWIPASQKESSTNHNKSVTLCKPLKLVPDAKSKFNPH